MLFHLVQIVSGALCYIICLEWIVPKHPVDNSTAVKSYQGMRHLNKKRKRKIPLSFAAILAALEMSPSNLLFLRYKERQRCNH